MNFTREILYARHRLSHQQIDRCLGENRSKDYLQEKIRCMKMVKNFLTLTDLLQQNEVFFINLKGPLLSYRIYHDPTIRFWHDIDLLIEEKDIERVMKILFENGYCLAEGTIWPQNRIQQKLFINSFHHLIFFNKQQLYVEIHWVLLHEIPLTKNKMKGLVAGNLADMEFNGRKFMVLNKEIELLFLMIHGSRHGWNRLKWLVDINDYPLEEVDLRTFHLLANQLHAGRIVGQTNYFVQKYFNNRIPLNGNNRLPGHFIRYAQLAIDREINEDLSVSEMIAKYRYLWVLYQGLFYKIKMTAIVLMRPGKISFLNLSYKLADFLYPPYRFIKRSILKT